MRSPFSIFRKYQKAALAILLFVAMILFIVGDSMRNFFSGNMPILLIVIMVGMVGAAIGAFIGMQTGKPREYAIAGIVVGAVVSFVVSIVGGTDAAVETTAGDLTQKQLDHLVSRRQTANSFVSEVYQRVSPPPQGSNPFMMQFWEARLHQLQFSNGLAIPNGRPEVVRQSLEDDVLFGYLLEQEANKMDVVVTDEAVDSFIKSIQTFGFAPPDAKLPLDQVFRDALGHLRMSESQLYEALRGELRVRTALHTLAPSSLQAPEEYWRVFRQLNVREKLDVAAVPVEDFTKEVADPAEADLFAFFDRYKAVAPFQMGPDAPGFYQPRRFELAFLEAPFEEFKAKVPAVTDAEVEEFYEKNKENYKSNPFPDSAKDSKAQQDPDLNVPLNVDVQPEKGEPPASDPAKSAEPSQGSDKPADTPEGQKSDAPANESAPTDATKSDAEKSGETPAQPKKEPNKAEPNKGASFLRGNTRALAALPVLIDPTGATSLLALVSQDAAKEKEDGESKPAETPAGSPQEPAADGGKSQPTGEAVKPEKEATPAADDQPPASTPAPSGESADSVRAPKPGEKPPVPEYRPLDEKLRVEIRNELLRQRTQELMKVAIRDASEAIFKLRNLYITVDDQGNRGITPEAITAQIRTYADEHGLKYHQTQYLSIAELRDGAGESIGTATDPLDGQFNPGAASAVWQRLNQTSPVQLFDPSTVESPLTSNLNVVWKTGDQAEHVPSLDEPGIRETVIAAWKIERARPLAEKRARELAEMAINAKKGLAEALKGQTVTGKEGDAAVTTRLSESFSWLRESAAPQTDIFQRSPPRLSEVGAIKNMSNDFMKTVFDQMAEGEIRAIPNRDNSIFYIVHVLDRFPADLDQENALRQMFLRENLFMGMFGETPYRYQMRLQDGRIHMVWVQELRKKYNVRWTPLSRGPQAM